MADSPILPGDRAWKDASGRPLPVEFYRFLRDLVGFIAQIQGNTAELTDILARLDALEAAGAVDIDGPLSVQVLGSAPNFTLQLFGDQLSPGPKFAYATDAAGQKGWFERLLSTLADVDLTGLADGDAIVWDAGAMKFVPGDSGSSLFTRITDTGDIRRTTQNDLRVAT